MKYNTRASQSRAHRPQRLLEDIAPDSVHASHVECTIDHKRSVRLSRCAGAAAVSMVPQQRGFVARANGCEADQDSQEQYQEKNQQLATAHGDGLQQIAHILLLLLELLLARGQRRMRLRALVRFAPTSRRKQRVQVPHNEYPPSHSRFSLYSCSV